MKRLAIALACLPRVSVANESCATKETEVRRLAQSDVGVNSSAYREAYSAWESCVKEDSFRRGSGSGNQQRRSDAEASERRGAEMMAERETERQERERKLAADLREYEALKADKKVVRLARSAYLCAALESREYTMGEIQTTKKYARIGGSLDLRKMHYLQEGLRVEDAWIATARARLRASKVKPLPCSNDEVATMSHCWNDGRSASCKDPRAAVADGEPE